MNNLASSSNCLNHFFTSVSVELLRTVVARDNKLLMAERDGTSFGFSSALVMVTPDFEIVA